MTLTIEKDGWEVCAHRHIPMGDLPDISSVSEWSWAQTSIPFDAISWLSKCGHGLDPMQGFNDHQYRWTEDVDWILRKKLSVAVGTFSPDDEIQIALADVDCYFELFINGHHIGHGRNQFREHVFDIDESVLSENNELLLYIRSARNVNSVMETLYGQLPAGYDTGRVHARRSQCLTGWDWTARLSSVSLLTPPVIRRNHPIQLAVPHAYVANLPAVSPGQKTVDRAELHIEFDLSSRRRATGELTIKITDLSSGATIAEKSESLTIKPKSVQLRRLIELENPQLWWSLGMGSQALYRVDITLNASDRLGLDYGLSQSAVFGVRTVTIEKRKDESGESFTPNVNGVPVFCRGANWIPISMLPASVSSRDLQLLICAAIGAGMNCLRVWGGGIYETDEFYSLCDQAGILVWQDFMFTCAAYPTHREFLDEVEAEVIYQVMRLRNHPSLLLWCGNSENEWLHQTGGLKKGNEQKVIGETIWAHLIRQLVEDYDPSRMYHQSSPLGKNRVDFNDQDSGDRHHWDVWADWQNTDGYLQDTGRFISEFGFQALPDLESIHEFAPSSSSINSLELTHHQKMIEGQERIGRYLVAHYHMPSSLSEWVDASQKMQAEILRRAVEHWRRLRFDTAGTLLWQLHDAYPAISWSIIDYYRRPKQSYEASKRFFAPVLLSMELLISESEAGAVPPELWPVNRRETVPNFPVEGGELVSCEPGLPPVQTRFVIVNDTHLRLSGDLIVQFLRLEAEPIVLDTVSVDIEPNATLIPLTHDIGTTMMKDIDQLSVRAKLELDEVSQALLTAMGDAVRDIQLNLSKQSVAENGSPWLFDETKGLSLWTPLVEPKYYSGVSGL